jgi:type IV secretory pathway TraG/TraD family ATPase VirD4
MIMQSAQWIPWLGAQILAHPMLVAGVLGGLLLFGMVLQVLTGGRRAVPLTTHGSARFATPREVKQAKLATKHGVVIGEVE